MAKKTQGDSPELAARARQRVLDVMRKDARKAMSIKDLSTALGNPEPIGTNISQRERLAKEAVKQLLRENDKRIYEHPKVGNSPRYGASPPDPRNYFRKSDLEGVQTKYAQLLKVDVRPGEILAAIGEKLNPP